MKNNDSIYKYYAPNEYNLDALINKYFWFSKRAYLNDPFDMNSQILNTFPKFKELLETRGYDLDKYNKILDDFAICSFTNNPNNLHFWSLYAGNFQGWCLELNKYNLVNPLDGVPNKLYGMIYLDEIPNLNDQYQRLEIEKTEDGGVRSETIIGLLLNERTQEELFTYLLRIKNKEIWAAEEECRLILGNHYLMTHKKSGNERGFRIPWQDDVIKQIIIIIGYKIPSYLRKIIFLLAKQKNLPVCEAKPDLQDRLFTIKIEPIAY